MPTMLLSDKPLCLGLFQFFSFPLLRQALNIQPHGLDVMTHLPQSPECCIRGVCHSASQVVSLTLAFQAC